MKHLLDSITFYLKALGDIEGIEIVLVSEVPELQASGFPDLFDYERTHDLFVGEFHCESLSSSAMASSCW